VFHQVTIRVADLGAAKRFYGTTLGALGVEPSRAEPQRTEWEDFAVVAAEEASPPTGNLHIGFVAPSRDYVDAFWRAGTGAGFEDDGAPGERPEYTPGYYGAFLRDPDGNSAEAVHHDDVRRGGHVDHLWIGVPELDPAVAFYATTMRWLGLRQGRRWEAGHQFRGAWATFSLIADGRPRTENLGLAFPAPDRETVAGFHAAATAAGYRDAGAPAARRSPDPAYAAAVLDPNGTRVESMLPRGSGPDRAA
jgi:catechol 2,3-dioxygenase-like lactoylglutathione lyase family enzyme